MGEGVNDAPALKTADVGIAVVEASDVARGASDVILLQKDLRVVVNGIKDGRIIFANINKYIKCALASNFGNFYSIAVISLFINSMGIVSGFFNLSNISSFGYISINFFIMLSLNPFILHLVLNFINNLRIPPEK